VTDDAWQFIFKGKKAGLCAYAAGAIFYEFVW
jgi:hypothetical protein